MSEPRLVMCKKLGKELPGLAKPPYKNELGQRIFEEIYFRCPYRGSYDDP